MRAATLFVWRVRRTPSRREARQVHSQLAGRIIGAWHWLGAIGIGFCEPAPRWLALRAVHGKEVVEARGSADPGCNRFDVTYQYGGMRTEVSCRIRKREVRRK